MRSLRLKITILIMLGALMPSNLLARGVWSVVTTTKLDPRVMLQLMDLARQNHATVRVLSVAPKTTARSARGDLTIEFSETVNLDQFTDRLKQSAGVSAKNLSGELASDGYTIVATYEKAPGPRNVEVTAANAGGFHNALMRFPPILRGPGSKVSAALAPPPQSFSQQQIGARFQISITDFPSFPERGIVEGFYGKPWS